MKSDLTRGSILLSRYSLNNLLIAVQSKPRPLLGGRSACIGGMYGCSNGSILIPVFFHGFSGFSGFSSFGSIVESSSESVEESESGGGCLSGLFWHTS